MGQTLDFKPGDTPVLVEEGGAAIVKILRRTDEPGLVSFSVRFQEILIQYPYVPYQPGDEIEINVNPDFSTSGYGWRFETLEYWKSWRVPELPKQETKP